MTRATFGNREIAVADLVRLAALIGPVGEDADEPDALFFRAEREQYTRAEVLEAMQILARMKPDECEMSGEDLRLWWD